MPSNITVNYKGSIEKDKVQKLFQEYHFMFMPTTGENFGHIIFEALNTGCPVIISDQTPWLNLTEKKAGWDIPLSEPRKYADAINAIINMDQQEYDIWSKNAFDNALKYINNKEIVEKNRNLFLNS